MIVLVVAMPLDKWWEASLHNLYKISTYFLCIYVEKHINIFHAFKVWTSEKNKNNVPVCISLSKKPVYLWQIPIIWKNISYILLCTYAMHLSWNLNESNGPEQAIKINTSNIIIMHIKKHAIFSLLILTLLSNACLST